MAGGLPMGATLIGARMGALPAQVHGSTFGGNPLGVRGIAGGDRFHRGAAVWPIGRRNWARGSWISLKQIKSPLIREVRGLGLMVGIELKQKVTPYLQELMKHGVLALPAGLTTMRFLPPLVVEQADLARVVAAVREVLSTEIVVNA